ncbi:MAG: hypothetical protein M3326_02190 [Actinomycetota bacterium]|nr:hypothetical protein [Actinomycetota bacterium]
MRCAHALAAAATAAVLAGCGGTATEPPASKATWMAAHGNAITTLNRDLEVARKTLSSLQRPDILGSCNQLRDSLGEARKGLPVPDPDADAALRTALDAVAAGTEDCVQGARGPDIPQLERSFGELREANTLMDVANQRLDAWR